MRQPQQNKRMRGRGRKPTNSGNRVLESNGPDVKVRGSASHIAEKYVTLARDAQVAGDRIVAENYLQHAEHFFRIVAAAQPQQTQTPNQNQNQNAQPKVGQSANIADDGGNADKQNNTQQSEQNAAVESRDSSAENQGSGGGAPKSRGRRRRKPDTAAAPGQRDAQDQETKGEAGEQEPQPAKKTQSENGSGQNGDGESKTVEEETVEEEKTEIVAVAAEENVEPNSAPDSDESVELA